MNEAKHENWTKHFLGREISYPAEYVIKIFKGKYPNLNLSQNGFVGKKICDFSCGDGRHLQFFKNCGFDVYATEISEGLVKIVSDNIKPLDLDMRVGNNIKNPFSDSFFDYFLSWNACYYMDDNLDFDIHVREIARTIKKGGGEADYVCT